MAGTIRTAAALALALTGLMAFGGGPVPANHVQCGDVITQDTTLDSDISGCQGRAIVIGADHVTLNLNGHFVSAEGDPGIGIDNRSGYDWVTIERGRVSGSFEAIRLEQASHNRLRQLSVDSTERGVVVVASDRSSIEDVIAVTYYGPGISLTDSDRNRIRGSAGSGLRNYGMGLVRSNHNRIEASVGDGGFGSFGELYGIALHDSDGNWIEGSSFGGNFIGMLLSGSDHNRIARNQATSTGQGRGGPTFPGAGIWIEGSGWNSLVGNKTVSNGFDGIFVDGGSLGSVLRQNTANRNGDDGIDVEDATASLARNAANNNGDLGIEAVPDVRDGRGNRASGNGNPLQCLNIPCR